MKIYSQLTIFRNFFEKFSVCNLHNQPNWLTQLPLYVKNIFPRENGPAHFGCYLNFVAHDPFSSALKLNSRDSSFCTRRLTFILREHYFFIGVNLWEIEVEIPQKIEQVIGKLRLRLYQTFIWLISLDIGHSAKQIKQIPSNNIIKTITTGLLLKTKSTQLQRKNHI